MHTGCPSVCLQIEFHFDEEAEVAGDHIWRVELVVSKDCFGVTAMARVTVQIICTECSPSDSSGASC